MKASKFSPFDLGAPLPIPAPPLCLDRLRKRYYRLSLLREGLNPSAPGSANPPPIACYRDIAEQDLPHMNFVKAAHIGVIHDALKFGWLLHKPMVTWSKSLRPMTFWNLFRCIASSLR